LSVRRARIADLQLLKNPSDLLETLHSGQLYRFADWPNPAVPRFAAGVYTIWDTSGTFVYAGMSGRGITDTTTDRKQGPVGLYMRLHSHASGRRSGDQFCVYVADRIVLPILSPRDIREIAGGQHSMDAFVRRYIHEQLGYRFVVTTDGASAYKIERSVCSGEWGHGRPQLNPRLT
jgi:hypothetical protein